MPSSLFGTRASQPVPAAAPGAPMQQTAAPNPNAGRLQTFMKLMRSGGNIQSFVQNEIANDPNGAMVMNLIQQNGGNAQAAFYALAKQKGADPAQFLAMFK